MKVMTLTLAVFPTLVSGFSHARNWTERALTTKQIQQAKHDLARDSAELVRF